MVLVYCCLGTTSSKEGFIEEEASKFTSNPNQTIPNDPKNNIHKNPKNTERYKDNTTLASSLNSQTIEDASVGTNSMFADKSTLGQMTTETYANNTSNPKPNYYKTKYSCELHGFHWDNDTLQCNKPTDYEDRDDMLEGNMHNKKQHSDKHKSLDPSEYTDKQTCTQAEYLWLPSLQVCLNSQDYKHLKHKKKQCAKNDKTMNLDGKCIDCPEDKRWSHTKKNV